jgi:hypothetical protein
MNLFFYNQNFGYLKSKNNIKTRNYKGKTAKILLLPASAAV